MATNQCTTCGGEKVLPDGKLCPVCESGEMPDMKRMLKDPQPSTKTPASPKPKAQ